MEINIILEIIVLIAIIIELISLTRHAKLEHKIDEHILRLDEHIIKLDNHIDDLNHKLESNSEAT